GTSALHERLRRAREELARCLSALTAPRALRDHGLEALIGEVFLELLGLERERALEASIDDPRETGPGKRDGPGGLVRRAAGHRDLARAGDENEALDQRRVARQGVAAESLPDDEVDRQLRADGRPERRRLDPEVVRRQGRGEEDDEGERGGDGEGDAAREAARESARVTTGSSF